MSTETLQSGAGSTKTDSNPAAAAKSASAVASKKNEGGYHVGQSSSGAGNLIDWLKDNVRTLVAVVVVLTVGGLGFSLYQGNREKKAAEARDALYVATKALQTKIGEIEKTPEEKPIPGKKKAPAAPVAPSVRAKLTEIAAEKEAVLKVAEKHPGTRAAFESLLSVADLELDRGDAESAAKHYEAAVRAAQSPFDRDHAKLSLGYALEATGKKAEALTAWTQVADSGVEGTLAAEALISQARVQVALGKKAEAQKALERALTVAPGSEMAQRAERLKATLP
jgi:predicted negative regulator of RcsB-dependent stress response